MDKSELSKYWANKVYCNGAEYYKDSSSIISYGAWLYEKGMKDTIEAALGV